MMLIMRKSEMSRKATLPPFLKFDFSFVSIILFSKTKNMIVVRKGAKIFDGETTVTEMDESTLLLAKEIIKKVNHLFLVCSNTQ